MPSYTAPVDDMMFLFEKLRNNQKYNELEKYKEVTTDLVKDILQEAAKINQNLILPLAKAGDENPAVLENGVVRTPPGYKEAYKKYIEDGWTSLSCDPKYGGQGMPKTVSAFFDEMLSSASLSFKLYSELSIGAYNCINHHASDEIKEKYTKLISKDFIDKIFPIIIPGKSDSASMDMVLELLLMTGRSLPEIMMILVPEAWEKHKSMDDSKKAFYEFNSCLMEPWDGPASIPFTDGKYIGALLDRNGLRPSRYTVTKDGYVVMSSETGVIEIKPENIEKHGRLEPGKMFLVDMNAGRIVEDEEIKKEIVSKHPYRKWVKDNVLPLSKIPYTGNRTPEEKINFETRLKIFGYTKEDFNTIIIPMCKKGKESIGSMGSDTPLAILSKRPQLLYNYFKQLFAQVTNPPLDGIREEIVTDTSLSVGSDYNIFDLIPEHAKKLKINNPIISNEDLDKIKYIKHKDFKAASVKALYKINKGRLSIQNTQSLCLS